MVVGNRVVLLLVREGLGKLVVFLEGIMLFLFARLGLFGFIALGFFVLGLVGIRLSDLALCLVGFGFSILGLIRLRLSVLGLVGFRRACRVQADTKGATIFFFFLHLDDNELVVRFGLAFLLLRLLVTFLSLGRL